MPFDARTSDLLAKSKPVMRSYPTKLNDDKNNENNK
jgi:hypothetical protein